MATLNSLLFLFSTMAPNMEPPGNYPVNQVPVDQYFPVYPFPDYPSMVPPYRENVPVLRQTACRLKEHPSCQYHCQKNCSNYDQDIHCPDVCVFGCVCVEPFIRAPDGDCIMPDHCPATPETPVTADSTDESDDISCEPDEEVSKYAHCPRNCTNVGQTIYCDGEGPSGCRCKYPKIRGPDGSCIMPEECPLIQQTTQIPLLTQTACRLKEHPSCKYHCQKNCSNYDQDIQCPDVCVFGCVCVEPFIRASNGDCIMPDHCPATPETPVTADSVDESEDILCEPDEEVSKYAHCPRNCTNVDQTIYCDGEGPRGCRCKYPKIRGPDGSCIMPEECPQVQQPTQFPVLRQTACRLKEHPSCKYHCQKNCSNYDHDIPCPDICVFGCVCIDPFIRATNGDCIMPFQCPATPDTPVTTDPSEPDDIQCQDDEEVSSYAHCQRNCTNVGQMIICPGEGPRGCMCKYPKIRGPDGSCIMSDMCPRTLSNSQDPDDAHKIVCPINEYVSCFSHCQLNCTNYNKDFHCPKYCITGCICTPPLIRGPDGSCIMPEKCNELMAPQEAQDTPCRDIEECDDSDDTDKENEVMFRAIPNPFDNFKLCEDENEVYKVCSSPCPDNCENYNDTRRMCKYICLPFPKCECKEEFVRGPSGKCIRKEECTPKEIPSEICPENEEYKAVCGSTCEKNCENYDLDIYCEAVCKSGCFCKEPMIRGPDGKCIHKEECPAKLSISSSSSEDCPENEEYKECGTACQKNCYDYDKNIPCEFKCESGCFCKEPLVRGPDGKCVHREECPARSTIPRQPRINSNLGFLPDFPRFPCGEYEVFSVCAPVCPDDCTNYKEDRDCKKICMPACKCIHGYVRRKDGKCIKTDECEEKKENICISDLEEYNECGSHCEKDCYNYNDKNRKCKDRSCNPGCFCKPGLVRSPDGRCIVAKDCPEKEEQYWSSSFLKKINYPF